MINLLITGGCGFIGSNFINYIFPKSKYKIGIRKVYSPLEMLLFYILSLAFF